MNKPKWGIPTHDAKTGEIGARMFAKVSHKGWDGHYEIDSHGKSSTEIATQIVDLEARHQRWADRMDTLQALVGHEITVPHGTFRITGCTMPPRSGEQHELIVGVRLVVVAQLRRVAGWPMTIPLRSVDDCPSNADIIAVATARLTEQQATAAAHEEFTAKVGKKLGLP